MAEQKPIKPLVRETLQMIGRELKEGPTPPEADWALECVGGPAAVTVLRLKQGLLVFAGGVQIANEHMAQLKALKPSDLRRVITQLGLALAGSGSRYHLEPQGQQIPQLVGLQFALFEEAANRQTIKDAHDCIVDAVVKVQILVRSFADPASADVPMVSLPGSKSTSVQDWPVHMVAVTAEVMEALLQRAEAKGTTTGEVVAELLADADK
jgi:hypothetical protein